MDLKFKLKLESDHIIDYKLYFKNSPILQDKYNCLLKFDYINLMRSF